MKPFLFALRQEPSQRLDLSRLTPDRLVGRTQKEIEAIDIGTTKVDAKVGDLFKIRVGDPQVVHFEGGSERFDLLGAKLLPGFTIHVEGDVGAQLGRGAQGGTITIAGDAGAFAASGMTGGQIDIGGDCGDFLGAPLAGEIAGMAGGRVVVGGNAGQRAGDRLRRGLIIIEGDAGADLGARAIAGTIIALGATTGRIGYLNKRAHAGAGAGGRLRSDLCRLRRASLHFRQTLLARLGRGQPARLAAAVAKAAALRGRHGGVGQGRDIDPGLTRANLVI